LAGNAGGFAQDVVLPLTTPEMPLTKRLTDDRFTHRYCCHEIAFERYRVDRVRC
jgi:hypothetical protein